MPSHDRRFNQAAVGQEYSAEEWKGQPRVYASMFTCPRERQTDDSAAILKAVARVAAEVGLLLLLLTQVCLRGFKLRKHTENK